MARGRKAARRYLRTESFKICFNLFSFLNKNEQGFAQTSEIQQMR